jgi:hypothetical protein
MTKAVLESSVLKEVGGHYVSDDLKLYQYWRFEDDV